MRRFLVTALILATAPPAEADHLTVTVVEIAGGLAYLDKGSKDGVERGTRITFGGDVLIVVEATQASAVVELGAHVLAIGTTGTAVVMQDPSATKVLPKPRPPEAFHEQWPAPELPATRQTPARVALGSGRARGAASLTAIGHGVAVADRRRTDASAEARVIASFDVMTERPLAADVDVAGRVYRGGANSNERVPVFVRAAQLRYGDATDPRFTAGRLRYAASAVGMLDGARASARFSNLELAAFGGLVPDPISGKPDTSASRFGGEVVLDRSTGWRPRVAVTAHGSTWDGELDEKRLAVSASANRAALWLDGWAEAQAFSSNNPWGARSLEVTGAGATAAWRERGKHLAIDITFLRPERSLRLAAALPPAWLCTQRPQPGDIPDGPCDDNDSWTTGSISAGVRRASWSVDAIGAIGRTDGIATAYDASGLLVGELRFGPRRIFAGVSAGQASFARWTAGHLGAGLVLSRRLDVAVTYRPELLDYVAATEATVLHSGIFDVHYAVSGNLDVALSGVGTTGSDRDMLAILSTIIWRPLP